MTQAEPIAGATRDPPPQARPGFASTAAYFERLAGKVRDDDRRQWLLEVAGFYRTLAGILPAMPKNYKHQHGAPPMTNAERWRRRAEQCQTLAECVAYAICRRQLKELAADCERLAIAAE
jgi:hypothetical protein